MNPYTQAQREGPSSTMYPGIPGEFAKLSAMTGPPVKADIYDPAWNYGSETWTAPEAMAGKYEYHENNVIINVGQARRWLNEFIAPMKQTRSLMSFTRTLVFDDHLADLVAPEGPPSLGLFRKFMEGSTIRRRARAMVADHESLMTEEGLLIYQLQILQMATTILNAVHEEVLEALLHSHDEDPVILERHFLRNATPMNVLAWERDNFGALNKPGDSALSKIINNTRLIFEQSGSKINWMIVPPGVTTYFTLADKNLHDMSKRGLRADKYWEFGSFAMPSFAGIPVVENPDMAYMDNADLHQALERTVTIGDYFMAFDHVSRKTPGAYATSKRSVRAYNFSTDRFETLDLKWFIRHCNRRDTHHTNAGQLSEKHLEILRRPDFNAPNGYIDMYVTQKRDSASDTNPHDHQVIDVIGDMMVGYLNDATLKHCGETFSAALDRRGFGNAKFEALSSFFADYSAPSGSDEDLVNVSRNIVQLTKGIDAAKRPLLFKERSLYVNEEFEAFNANLYADLGALQEALHSPDMPSELRELLSQYASNVGSAANAQNIAGALASYAVRFNMPASAAAASAAAGANKHALTDMVEFFKECHAALPRKPFGLFTRHALESFTTTDHAVQRRIADHLEIRRDLFDILVSMFPDNIILNSHLFAGAALDAAGITSEDLAIYALFRRTRTSFVVASRLRQAHHKSSATSHEALNALAKWGVENGVDLSKVSQWAHQFPSLQNQTNDLITGKPANLSGYIGDVADYAFQANADAGVSALFRLLLTYHKEGEANAAGSGAARVAQLVFSLDTTNTNHPSEFSKFALRLAETKANRAQLLARVVDVPHRASTSSHQVRPSANFTNKIIGFTLTSDALARTFVSGRSPLAPVQKDNSHGHHTGDVLSHSTTFASTFSHAMPTHASASRSAHPGFLNTVSSGFSQPAADSDEFDVLTNLPLSDWLGLIAHMDRDGKDVFVSGYGLDRPDQWHHRMKRIHREFAHPAVRAGMILYACNHPSDKFADACVHYDLKWLENFLALRPYGRWRTGAIIYTDNYVAVTNYNMENTQAQNDANLKRIFVHMSVYFGVQMLKKQGVYVAKDVFIRGYDQGMDLVPADINAKINQRGRVHTLQYSAFVMALPPSMTSNDIPDGLDITNVLDDKYLAARLDANVQIPSGSWNPSYAYYDTLHGFSALRETVRAGSHVWAPVYTNRMCYRSTQKVWSEKEQDLKGVVVGCAHYGCNLYDGIRNSALSGQPNKIIEQDYTALRVEDY